MESRYEQTYSFSRLITEIIGTKPHDSLPSFKGSRENLTEAFQRFNDEGLIFEVDERFNFGGDNIPYFINTKKLDQETPTITVKKEDKVVSKIYRIRVDDENKTVSAYMPICDLPKKEYGLMTYVQMAVYASNYGYRLVSSKNLSTSGRRAWQKLCERSLALYDESLDRFFFMEIE